MIGQIAGQAIGAVAGLFRGRQQRKAKRDEIEGQIKLAKQQQEGYAQISVDNWEQAQVNQQAGTWKDEFALVVVAAPFIITYLAALLGGFTCDFTPLPGTDAVPACPPIEAAKLATQSVREMPAEFWTLFTIVITAATGIKMIRRLL